MLSTRVGTSAPRLNARAPPQHYDLHRIMSEFLGLGLYNRHRQAVQRNRFFTEPRQFCALNPLWSEAPQRTLYIMSTSGHFSPSSGILWPNRDPAYGFFHT